MAFSLLKAHQPTQAYYFPFQDIQAWSGDTAAFAVADSALWLDAPSGGTWELSHPLQGGPDWQWQGSVQLDFNPSSVNCAWRQLAPAGSFLLPDETRAFVMSPPALVNDYPLGDSTFIATAASLPPLDDDHGELLLLTSQGQRLDQAFYDDALHHPSLGQGEGIAILKQVDHWISAGADSATPGRSPPLVRAPLMGLMDIQHRHFGWLSGQHPLLSFALRAEGPWVIQEALFSIDGTWTITWSDPLPVQSVDHWSCHVLPPKSARGAALWVLQWTASTGRVIRRSFPIIID